MISSLEVFEALHLANSEVEKIPDSCLNYDFEESLIHGWGGTEI